MKIVIMISVPDKAKVLVTEQLEQPERLQEYCVWYSDDTLQWAAAPSPMHGPVTPPSSSCSWMFVGAIKAASESDAVAKAQHTHPRLSAGPMRSTHT